MKSYRIIRKNTYFGWKYFIQRKFLCFWINTIDQPYISFSLEDCERVLKKIIISKLDYIDRKKDGNKIVLTRDIL